MAPGLAQPLLQQYALRGRPERVSYTRRAGELTRSVVGSTDSYLVGVRATPKKVTGCYEDNHLKGKQTRPSFAHALAEGQTLKSDRMNIVSLLKNASTSDKDTSLLWISRSISVPDVIFTSSTYAC